MKRVEEKTIRKRRRVEIPVIYINLDADQRIVVTTMWSVTKSVRTIAKLVIPTTC